MHAVALPISTASATVRAFDSREEWLEARRFGIGGSDAAAVLGVSQWSSRYTLWALKTGMVERASAETAPMRWGHKIEPVIADEYQLVTGRKLIDPGPFTIARSTECPFMFATHDRLIQDDVRGLGILSIKNVDKSKANEWCGDFPAPLEYQVQLQHELAVSGAAWGSFAVLIGGNDFRTLDVVRDDAFIVTLKQECFHFWQLVESKTEPPIDPSESTATTLRRMYPRDNGATVELPADALDWDAKLITLKEELRILQDERRLYENKMIAAMGSASLGTLPNGARYSYRTIERKAYNVEKSTFRELRRIKAA